MSNSDRIVGKFALPQASQTQSNLLQLPQEIRTLILQLLLVADNGLSYTPTPNLDQDVRESLNGRNIDWKDLRSSLHRNFSLWPKVLQTCQMLYGEGHTMLYNENLLHLRLFVGPEWDYLDEENAWPDYTREIYAHLIHHSGLMILPQMQRFELLITAKLLPKPQVLALVHMVCSMFREVLREKEVRIRMLSPGQACYVYYEMFDYLDCKILKIN